MVDIAIERGGLTDVVGQGLRSARDVRIRGMELEQRAFEFGEQHKLNLRKQSEVERANLETEAQGRRDLDQLGRLRKKQGDLYDSQGRLARAQAGVQDATAEGLRNDNRHTDFERRRAILQRSVDQASRLIASDDQAERERGKQMIIAALGQVGDPKADMLANASPQAVLNRAQSSDLALGLSYNEIFTAGARAAAQAPGATLRGALSESVEAVEGGFAYGGARPQFVDDIDERAQSLTDEYYQSLQKLANDSYNGDVNAMLQDPAVVEQMAGFLEGHPNIRRQLAGRPLVNEGDVNFEVVRLPGSNNYVGYVNSIEGGSQPLTVGARGAQQNLGDSILTLDGPSMYEAIQNMSTQGVNSVGELISNLEASTRGTEELLAQADIAQLRQIAADRGLDENAINAMFGGSVDPAVRAAEQEQAAANIKASAPKSPEARLEAVQTKVNERLQRSLSVFDLETGGNAGMFQRQPFESLLGTTHEERLADFWASVENTPEPLRRKLGIPEDPAQWKEHHIRLALRAYMHSRKSDIDLGVSGLTRTTEGQITEAGIDAAKNNEPVGRKREFQPLNLGGSVAAEKLNNLWQNFNNAISGK